MDKARAAVSQFVGRSGHETTVDERQLPAVKHEEVQPIRKEEITTAVNREVHQDHYHTTVQPIKDREALPEKHDHQMAGIQVKEFEHANPQETRARLDREAQQFKDTSVTRNTQNIQAVGPTVEAERVHHHVHEIVQPVIEKEVIAPTVVHTTVPIHEKHHAAPEYHGTSVLPTKTMTDFKSTGQNLTGSTGTINQDQYEGCPRPYNPEMQLGKTEADANPHIHTSSAIGGGVGGALGSGTHSTAGPHQSDLTNKMDPRVDSDLDSSNRGMGVGMGGSPRTTDGPHNSNMANKLDPRVDSDRDGSHHQGGSTRFEGDPSAISDSRHTSSHASGVADPAGHKKPSLIDRLNPMKDSDGDGKKGFMK